MDQDRIYTTLNRQEEVVEATDCFGISLGSGFDPSCLGLCDNPITGTLCCPLVTASHLFCLPFATFLDCMSICFDCNERHTGYNDGYAKALDRQRELERVRLNASIAFSKPTTATPLPTSTTIDERKLAAAAEASKRQVAEREARYEAAKRQAEENRRREEQRWNDWKRTGTWG